MTERLSVASRLQPGFRIKRLVVAAPIDAKGKVLVQCDCGAFETRNASALHTASVSAAAAECAKCRKASRRKVGGIVRRYSGTR